MKDTQIGPLNTGSLATSEPTFQSVGEYKFQPPPVYKSIQIPDPYAEPAKPKIDPDKRQVGGDHYKKLKMQPIELVMQNDMGFCEGSAIKYICRHTGKGGADDIRKAIHYLQLLLKHKYGTTE